VDRQKVYAQLVADEGVRLVVYRDTLGNLTVGVGHLIRPGDNLSLGDTISNERCEVFFNFDLNTAIYECRKLLDNFDELPETAQEVLVNMMFNMGPNRLSEFHHFLCHVTMGQWVMASHDMEASLWFRQVGPRAKRLQSMIASLATKE
jgi:lysozyme